MRSAATPRVAQKANSKFDPPYESPVPCFWPVLAVFLHGMGCKKIVASLVLNHLAGITMSLHRVPLQRCTIARTPLRPHCTALHALHCIARIARIARIALQTCNDERRGPRHGHPCFEPGDIVGGICWCFAKPFTLLGSANWVAGEARDMVFPPDARKREIGEFTEIPP